MVARRRRLGLVRMGRGLRRRHPCFTTTTSTISLLTVMSAPSAHDPDTLLRSVVEHVFMPPKLPQKGPNEQMERETNVALCDNLLKAARAFLPSVTASECPLWNRMIRMIKFATFAATHPFQEAVQRVLSGLTVGGMFILTVFRP